MAKPTKKKRVVSEDKLREMANEAMEQFKSEAKTRYGQAHKLYAKQDDETQEAIDRMTTFLCRIARRHMWVGVGKRGDRIIFTIPEDTIYHNMFYMTTEILKDLASFDVKVAGFHLPKDLCAVCSTEIKVTKKKVVKKHV
jgi:hypothetical protein